MQGRNSSSSEDFFNTAAQPRRTTTAPPPPPRPGATRRPLARAPPRATTATTTRTAPSQQTRPAGTNSSTSAATTTSSYYAGGGSTAPYAARAPAVSRGSTGAGGAASYYGTGAPPSFASSARTPASTSRTSHAPSGATTTANNDGWYTGPSSMQQQSTPATNSSYMLNATSNSSFGQSTQHPPMRAAPTSGQMSGSMDGLSGPIMSSSSGSAPAPVASTPSTFVPRPPSDMSTASTGNTDVDYTNEPPLLEELGIRLDHIFVKTRAVVLPFRRLGHVEHTNLSHSGGTATGTAADDVHQLMQTADMAGPLVFALLLGGEMLLMGKLRLGYIYGFGMFGCLSMTFMLTLMKQPQGGDGTVVEEGISFWTVTSILGYALLPVNLLAFLKIFLSLGKLETLNRILGLVTIAWCTVASTRLVEQGCDMRPQRYLIAYPIALLYSAFVLITVF